MILSFDIGVKNLAFCKVHKSKVNQQISISDWQLLNIESASCIGITSTLDSIPDLLDNVSLVLIEKQMRVNYKMQFVSAALEMYLHNRALWMETKIIEIKRVPAWMRTKHVQTPPTCTDTALPKTKHSKSHASQQYRARKKASVQHALGLVSGGKWEEFFTKTKKQDDLADCLCQAELYVA